MICPDGPTATSSTAPPADAAKPAPLQLHVTSPFASYAMTRGRVLAVVEERPPTTMVPAGASATPFHSF
jgi:hypothetical protein